MTQELSRRDFLKVAGMGLGALTLGGLLLACGEKDARCDSERLVKLWPGDYVLTGDTKITLWGLIERNGKSMADISFEGVNIETGEPTYEGPGRMPFLIEIGEGLEYDYDNETHKPTRIIYRCGWNKFAFWDLKDFPAPTPFPTQTPIFIPVPTDTPLPAAIFP